MNPIITLKNSLRNMIIAAAESAKSQGLLAYESIPDIVLEVPREKEHGDFACNIAMLLAKPLHMAPKKIAGIIKDCIDLELYPQVKKIDIAGAGFINIFLTLDWLYEIPALVLDLGDDYGKNPSQDTKVQVEFVSANPTGNLHMGNARGGAIGDTLANILTKAGYSVEREFYINDAGNQIEILGDSLDARYLQLTGHDALFPENGYAGADVIETVKKIIKQENNQNFSKLPAPERKKMLIEYALTEKVNYIKNTLSAFGIDYDVWFSEKILHNTGEINKAIAKLKESGYIYEHEGASWFKSTQFGDDKDEVLIRANGVPTYFAADIAYHLNKFERGFDWVINIWGADHHGHVSRMKGAIQALGYDPARIDIIIMQLVRLYRGKTIVRMSKRTGTTVSLDDLIEEVGKDAARFFFIMRSPDSHLDFDLELAKQESQENPVYYVQYAHARICSIFRQATAAGQTMAEPGNISTAELQTPEELALLRKIADFPEEIRIAAKTLSPHRIAHYTMDLAGLFHSFYNHHRVLNDNDVLQNARLLLMTICKITIKNALDILGVSAPEQM